MKKGDLLMEKKHLTIKGNKITWESLFKEADEIIGVRDLVNSNRDLISMINNLFASSDDFNFKYFIQSGGLERLDLSLEYIAKRLEAISNNICPDEQLESDE